MESHSVEPKYECTECGKKFKSRAMWQHHGRLHTKVRRSLHYFYLTLIVQSYLVALSDFQIANCKV